MKRLDFPQGWYSDALPEGQYVVSPYVTFAPELRTWLGNVPLKGGEPLLYTVLADDGIQIAGIGNGGAVKDRALRWDGSRWHDHGEAFGPLGVIFDRANVLHVVHPPVAHGYRYVADDGRLVTAAETYADTARRIWEYTAHGDLTIGQGGQGAHGDDPLIALYHGKRYLIQPGRCRAVKFRRAGDRLAVAWVQEDTGSASVLWLTVAELVTFPEITETEPEPDPQPEPEPPVMSIPKDKILAIRDEVWADPQFTPKLMGNTEETKARSIDFLSEMVRRGQMRGLPEMGLLWKPGKGITADIIAWKPSSGPILHGDVLSGGDGMSETGHNFTPKKAWTDHGPIPTDKGWEWRMPDNLPEPEPKPEPKPEPPADNERLAALEATVAALTKAHDALVLRVTALEQRPTPPPADEATDILRKILALLERFEAQIR